MRRIFAALSLLVILSGCGGTGVSVMPAHVPPPPQGGGGGGNGGGGGGNGEGQDTWVGFHAFQVFDFGIPSGQATQDAHRYEAVWGSGEPHAWKQGNGNIRTSWYAPFDGDFTHQHDLAWWRNNHPDWVLYKCDRHTPAGLGGLPNVPLDISNPAVVQWQMRTYAPDIESGGYDALAEDLVGLDNANEGCGVWIDGVWHQRFSGRRVDKAWTDAVVAWHRYAFAYLHGLERPIRIWVNNVPENRPYGDAAQIALLDHVDLVDDESSFTDYGTGYAPAPKFDVAIKWMRYIQSLGEPYLVDDKWNTATLSTRQLEWALGTYLMGKDHHASLFVDHLPGYGFEYWHSQYEAPIGSPCADMVTDPSHANVYYRKYSGSFVVVNASANDAYSLKLPKQSYKNIEGGTVTSPMMIGPDDAKVLLTSNGCQ